MQQNSGRDIREFSSVEFQEFLDSFDTIMADCDGVLWLSEAPIAGALETIKMLENMGKRVVFVTNNNTRSLEDYLIKFRNMGYEANPEQIIISSSTIIWYLKKINFRGKAFAIGAKAFTDALARAGFDITTGPDGDIHKLDTIRKILKPPNASALIIDFDMNINWMKMVLAASVLEREDNLFLTGTRDEKVPITATKSALGPGPFLDILIKQSGRTPTEFAKPSEILKNYLTERYAITDPNRCIFVGDSLAVDMKFAALCGFSKLWVSSGVDKADAIKTISDVTPDYYLPDLGAMPRIVDPCRLKNSI